MELKPLKFPLTLMALRTAFEDLQPEQIRLDKQPGWHEATIDGAWTFARLTRHLHALGLAKVGGRDSVCFVDRTSQVGVVLHGVETHPTRNTFRSWTIEVIARKDTQLMRVPL